MRDDEALRLFVARDREALLARTAPPFEEVKADYLITHLYFITPEGEVFLRVHKPSKFGDVLQRITFLQAQSSGERSAGVEMGTLFFSLRSVRPVEFEGEFIGYVEAGQEIDEMSEKVKEMSGNEVSLWLRNDFIERKGTEIAGQQVGDFTLLSTTASPEAITQFEQAGLASILAQGLEAPGYADLRIGRSHFGVGSSPFQDAGGEVVGVLMTFQDNTAEYSTLARQLLYTIGLGLMILAGLIIVLNLMTRRSFASLARVTEVMQSIAQGDLQQVIDAETQDEAGRLANASGQMIAYMQNIAAAAERLAQGDLTVNVTPQSEQDVLGNAISQMIGNLRRLAEQLADNANQVGAASEQLARVAHQAGQATAQVAVTVQQIAQGTTRQTDRVIKTIDTVDQVAQAIEGMAQGAQEQATAVAKSYDFTTQISAAIQQVAANAQAGASGAANAAQAARAGSQMVEGSIQGMAGIKAKVGLSAQKVQEMGRRSKQIGAIVETIDDIASQTNLLALNAAIEAARAGEHGKGFAVVADEVRKLAEKSAAATREIGALIQGIQHTVGEAVAAMDEGAEEVESGVIRANEAGQALSSILKAVETVN
ncbi:MAG: methyl-accepting chemotaxis protein, partial [Anaerolineae bacterium]